MGLQLKTVTGPQRDRLTATQPHSQLPFEHEAALLRAVVQVLLATARPWLQVAIEHGERARYRRGCQHIGDATGQVKRAPLVRAGDPVELAGLVQFVKVGGRDAELFADGCEVGHGRARHAPFDLRQKAHRTANTLSQLAQRQAFELAQVANQYCQAFDFFVHFHS